MAGEGEELRFGQDSRDRRLISQPVRDILFDGDAGIDGIVRLETGLKFGEGSGESVSRLLAKAMSAGVDLHDRAALATRERGSLGDVVSGDRSDLRRKDEGW